MTVAATSAMSHAWFGLRTSGTVEWAGLRIHEDGYTDD
jgi:hypothetical protein